MGSWDETCALSHLPIQPATSVRILYLAKTRNTMGHGYNPADHYAPLMPIALRAVYADYGRVVEPADVTPAERRVYELQHQVLLAHTTRLYEGTKDNSDLENVWGHYNKVQCEDLKVYYQPEYCPEPLPVYGVFVREDVWQAYIQVEHQQCKAQKKHYGLLDRKKLTKAYLHALEDTKDKHGFFYTARLVEYYKPGKSDFSLDSSGFHMHQPEWLAWTLWSKLKFGLYQSHGSTPLELFPPNASKSDKAKIAAVLTNSVVDFTQVVTAMYRVRQGFTPTIGKGSQHCEYVYHAKLVGRIRKIALYEQLKHDEEYGSYGYGELDDDGDEDG